MEESLEIILESDLPPIGVWVEFETGPMLGESITFNADGTGAHDCFSQEIGKFNWTPLKTGWLEMTYTYDAEQPNLEPGPCEEEYTYVIFGGAAPKPGIKCGWQPFQATAMSLSLDLQNLFAANWPKEITKDDKWCHRNIAIDSGKFYEPKGHFERARDGWDIWLRRPLMPRVYKKSRIQSPREIRIRQELVGCSVVGCALAAMVVCGIFSYLALAGRIMNERLIDQIYGKGAAILFFLFLAFLLWVSVVVRSVKKR
ncbi:MAG: hypothetical protein K8R88_12745 [Armatimonadetes bacterium]|nr:hypothetical protein [Armatimonadota bacterium]